MTTKEVLDFLSERNRPVTVADVVRGLGEKTSKTKVQNALLQLVDDQQTIEKTYGKQKVYCVVQGGEDSKKTGEVILELERECSSLSLKLREVQQELGKNRGDVKAKQMRPGEAIGKKKEVEEEIQEWRLQVEARKSCEYSQKEVEKIEKEYGGMLKEYGRRKRLCMDMVEAMLENYPKTKKNLIEEIGLEVDEDVNFVVNKV